LSEHSNLKNPTLPWANAPERASLTPMMQQWYDCKLEAKEALLLFRMGDFYEAFYKDAEDLASSASLTLTKRADTPMSGIPYHQLENYLDKLIIKGFKVAIAEQIGEAKKGEGLVERKVIRTHTPGTLISSSLIQDKAYNTLAALFYDKAQWGLAYTDVTTDTLYVTSVDNDKALLDELVRLQPVEIVLPKKILDSKSSLFDELKLSFSPAFSAVEPYTFDHRSASSALLKQFHTQSLDGFGLRHMQEAISAAGALLTFIQEKLLSPLKHLKHLKHEPIQGHLAIDRITRRNLELFEPLHTSSKGSTLYELIDRTSTPMGARTLRAYLAKPLLDIQKISARSSAVATFMEKRLESETIREYLSLIKDLERLSSRICSGYANPKDLVSLKVSLWQIAPIQKELAAFSNPLIESLAQEICDMDSVTSLIDCALVDDPPWRLSDGGLFKSGYHKELDELALLYSNGSAYLAEYEQSLREKTGIKKLRIGYNRVFGYYIEVSRGQAELMPDSFIRKQTLANAERFISPELKSYEDKILSAEEKKSKLESSLFLELREKVASFTDEISKTSHSLGHIDTLLSLAKIAFEGRFCRPEVDTSFDIEIISGRHPVIEAAKRSERFIPNDTYLSDKKTKMAVITGPNMGGKSTYIRQVALITILAQIGSFVPASHARIGIVDRLFSRIGASDDLTRGQSTFMVEMAETANILNNATERSLIILDEIGRGTSTCDGIAIAQAACERLITFYPKGPKTLFATHFFELTDLEKTYPGVKNFHVAVDERSETIVFLRKIVEGTCDKSYGIHVAEIAGVPEAVVKRAKEILKQLESKTPSLLPTSASKVARPKKLAKDSLDQMTLFDLKPFC